MTTFTHHRFNLLLLMATLSFLPMLNLYYVGEEAIFPISSMEMWQHGVWFKQYLFGADLQHNPLFNWLIIVFSNMFGWTHVLGVARGLTICATLATAGMLGWLVWRLFRDREFAAFAALIYLTFSDVLIYHGWLAYVDPLFAMFIFIAIATLWIACAEKRQYLLWFAAIALTCAFLSKAFTAYVFYATALLVLAYSHANRKFLMNPVSLLAHFTMVLAPLAWFKFLPAGHAQSGRMFDEILTKLVFPSISDYISRLLLYPLETWSELLPAGLLVIYFALRGRITQCETHPEHFRSALLIAALSYIPYWIAPQGGIRYLIPIYPLFALIIARLIWRTDVNAINIAKRWIIAVIILNFILGLAIFPYYQKNYRGKNYALAATDIITLAKGRDLYMADVTTNGLNIAAYINQQRYPQQALQQPPEKFDSGFIVSRVADPSLGIIVKKYQLLKDEIFLLCRGESCAINNQ